MTTDLAAARRGRWAVAAMFFANGLVMGAWAPQIPLLLPRHGIGEGAMGLLILALGAGAVAAMALTGGLVARHGSRTVLRLFAVAASLTLAAVVLAPGLYGLTLAMVAMGACIGCMDVAMNANAVEVERRLGRAVMSSSHGFWSLGGFTGGGLGGLLIATLGAGAQALVVSMAALAVVLVAGRPLLAEPPAPAHAPARRGLPRGAAIWLIGLMALFCMVPEGAVLDWAALYVMQELGGGTASSGLAFGLFSAAMAAMRFAGDRVRNRFGAVHTLRASAVLAAVGLAAASIAPSEGWALAAFAVTGLGIANTVPITFSAAGNQPGLSPGAGISTVAMMGYSGILVAPSSIGVIAEQTGFRLTYAALALLLLVVAALAPRCAAADGRA
ncbi:fucose permease [Cereibacter ovatus]|uniref:Fucose permease n=1 Tax=Cereibacter ovatus TaxID=439529 RepID=A0A285CNM5_9RHOB|nr:MFS transporter [Cereibacter ovatus]SNX69121.1 fucose permease [Cereibacter ovatus]